MKKLLLLTLLSTTALAGGETEKPASNVTVNCDGCNKPIPQADLKIVKECPKAKTKTVTKWKTKTVAATCPPAAPITNNNYYNTGGSNQVYRANPNRVNILLGAPYKAITEYELKDRDYAHTYPLVGIDYERMVTERLNVNIGVYSDRFLFTGIGYNW